MSKIYTTFDKFITESLNPGDKFITTSYHVVTDESAEHGDFEETGWVNQEGESMMPDEFDIEEGITAVEKAIEFLKDMGGLEASCYPFEKGCWYTTTDPLETKEFFEEGKRKFHSFHLNGFSEKEQREIYNEVTK